MSMQMKPFNLLFGGTGNLKSKFLHWNEAGSEKAQLFVSAVVHT